VTSSGWIDTQTLPRPEPTQCSSTRTKTRRSTTTLTTNTGRAGIANYISAEAVDDTLAAVKELASLGSTLIFTYVDKAALDSGSAFPDAAPWINGVKRRGEPWTFGLHPAELRDFLAKRGFTLTADFSTAEAGEVTSVCATGTKRARSYTTWQPRRLPKACRPQTAEDWVWARSSGSQSPIPRPAHRTRDALPHERRRLLALVGGIGECADEIVALEVDGHELDARDRIRAESREPFTLVFLRGGTIDLKDDALG
jgi:hypothetical protein